MASAQLAKHERIVLLNFAKDGTSQLDDTVLRIMKWFKL